jgi:hypothetical protein
MAIENFTRHKISEILFYYRRRDPHASAPLQSRATVNAIRLQRLKEMLNGYQYRSEDRYITMYKRPGASEILFSCDGAKHARYEQHMRQTNPFLSPRRQRRNSTVTNACVVTPTRRRSNTLPASSIAASAATSTATSVAAAAGDGDDGGSNVDPSSPSSAIAVPTQSLLIHSAIVHGFAAAAPPPPPPPPPPAPPAPGLNRAEKKNGKKLRPLRWSSIPAYKLKETFWESPSKQKNAAAIQIDEVEMETLFSLSPLKKKNGDPNRSAVGGALGGRHKNISLLEVKRANNIGMLGRVYVCMRVCVD